MCAVAAGITYNLVYTFWYYDLEVTWWQNMQTYFYDVNSSISTSQLSDRYALEWNQLIHYYKCCGIEVRFYSTCFDCIKNELFRKEFFLFLDICGLPSELEMEAHRSEREPAGHTALVLPDVVGRLLPDGHPERPLLLCAAQHKQLVHWKPLPGRAS